MNKTIIAIVIVAVVVVGGYFILKATYQPVAPVSQPSSEQTAPQPSVSEQPSGKATPQPSVSQTLTAKENVVTYTDAGYSPATLTIKKGETVTFKNQSSSSMWTASGIHPTHRLYPTTGGCIGSIFDACKSVQSDDSWSFKFDIAGTWKYHNHLSPGDNGTIIVQ